MENKLDRHFDTLKTQIFASIDNDYKDALWAHKLTHKYHVKMGYQPERILKGNAKRFCDNRGITYAPPESADDSESESSSSEDESDEDEEDYDQQ